MALEAGACQPDAEAAAEDSECTPILGWRPEGERKLGAVASGGLQALERRRLARAPPHASRARRTEAAALLWRWRTFTAVLAVASLAAIVGAASWSHQRRTRSPLPAAARPEEASEKSFWFPQPGLEPAPEESAPEGETGSPGDSCAAYGCAEYDAANDCQCNAACKEHDNCCADVDAECGASAAAAARPVPQQASGVPPAAAPAAVQEPAAADAWRSPCGGGEACLELVDGFLGRQLDSALGLLKTRGSIAEGGGGPCGELCELPPADERSDVYDSAVAAIYHVKRGQFDRAKHILDVFVYLLYPEDLDGIDPDTIYQGLRSGRPLTLLAAGYSSTVKARAGEYWGDAVVDGAVDTGNNAWAALAFAHYAAAAGARSRPEAGCYAAVGRDVLEALARAAMCSDSLGGYLGRLPPYEDNYRSTEHNIDMAALAHALGDSAVSAHAERFVQQMHARNPGYPQAYSMGTGKELRCDSSQPMSAPVAADVQFWSLLAGADPEPAHAAGAVEFALQRPGPQLPPLPEGARDPPGSPEEAARIAATQGLWETDEDSIWAGDVAPPRLNGTRFTTWGHGIEWEETASACMAMVKHRQQLGGEADPRLTRRIEEARDSLCYLLAMYKGIPATVLGGNMEAWKRNDHRSVYPGGSDTGIRWTYLRYLHVAATAWTGLLLLYQADGSSPVLEDANPMGAPADAVPLGRADLSCLPPRPRPSRDPPGPSGSSRRRGEPGRRVD